MALATTQALGPSVIQPMVAAHRQQIKAKIIETQASIDEAKRKSVQIAALVAAPAKSSVGEQVGQMLDIAG